MNPSSEAPSVPAGAQPGSLVGRTAVVTGAAGGIGRAIVAALLDAGARVHGLDRDAKVASATLVDPDGRKPGWAQRYRGWQVDLALRADTDRVLAELAPVLAGRCDILVNNAGISIVRPFAASDDALIDLLFAVNFTAAFRLTRGLVSLMAAGQGASIVNIASELALIGQPGFAVYSATKGAILGWTRSLAMELAPQGIRVNAVCPGPIETPMLTYEFDLTADPAAARQREIDTVPLARLGRPRDIAAVVAFLASDAAAFVQGAAWTVDGGKTIA